MHRDGIGDRLQVERPQVLNTMCEECILLAHNLFGDAQNGARPLVETFDQPVGRLQAIDQLVVVFAVFRGLSDLRQICAIDQDAGQRVAVEF